MTKTFRAPGRTELGGNHTDHQHGKVLAAGINLYITAEAESSALSDQELKDKTPALKQRLADGETLDDILPEAFAVVREAG